MLPFGVTIPASVLQRSEIKEGLMNYPVYYVYKKYSCDINCAFFGCNKNKNNMANLLAKNCNSSLLR
jgi:hypothetical protein